MRGYGKEEIEMQSLESCPHIIGNPLNSVAYHPYATVTSLSSLQSFPRRNVSRNPSIISNPLDNYYMDNELSLYRFENRQMMPRVSGNANIETFRETASYDETAFRVFDENENQQYINERRRLAEYEIIRNSTNELMNTRNRAHSASRLSQNSGTSSLNRESDQHQDMAFVRLPPNPEDIENSRNRYTEENQLPRLYYEDQRTRNSNLDHPQIQDDINHNITENNPRRFAGNRRLENDDRNQDEAQGSDEETGNFGALADIRESRV